MKKNLHIYSSMLFLITTLSLGAEAQNAPESVCSQFETPRKENCMAAFQRIPNKKALAYTLKYLKINSQGLKDPSCLKGGQNLARNGIKNTCSFVINDLTSQYQGNPLRANAYYVDLCATGSGSIVKSFYVNKGSGTARADYADREGAHSSNAGAYLTGTQIVEFIPYHLSNAYKKLKETIGGFIPALDLYGLHSTNNNTADSKPMHASPYKSSWGCPSVSAAATGIMRDLAKRGPSLVMNYGPSKFHPEESLTSCNAVPELVAGKMPKGTHRLPKSASRWKHGRMHVTYALHSRRHHRHHHYHHSQSGQQSRGRR